MGLFSQRPEETNEWAGLPSEPANPESAAERLADAAPVDVGGLGFGDLALGGGGAVESIVFPVKPAVEIVQSQESGENE
ncbi:hypothetical protein R8Z57_09520 [Microbacterium sp. M3]|uniref:Uncharacterized protein n=1 Tax=Microbacterium arthrosphaerae TaxID=792652 RepID=A0ABU4H2V9_9MICO|nr:MULTISPECIES: hypothetical protein [Microbacterium]MDW4573005.1 hypothetical protein [Microbacterium arthrosphaerae]MDW7606860.1 hypothetical protein [Microbacterium sp. M3]